MRGLDVVTVLLLMPSTAIAQTTLFELTSGEPDDDFGSSVANVGDLDRDGFADLGVGAPGSDLGGVDAGAAYVYSGRTGFLLLLWKGEGGDQLGGSLSSAGDADGDGFADILVGARQRSQKLWLSEPGYVRVYSGRSGEAIRTYVGSLPGDGLGTVVANVGDIDADGTDDHAMSATGGLFRYALVYSGHNGDILQAQADDFTIFGQALLGVGDFDGDGHDDYAIGEPIDTSVGITNEDSWVHVYSGDTGKILLELAGSEQMKGLGRALASPGDLDGDGKQDLWIGASFSGYAGLFAGVTGTSIEQEHHGRGFFGEALACPDVDGDGRGDLVVGAPRLDLPGVPFAGSVAIFSSTNGAELGKLDGQRPFEGMGTSLAALDDLNGDGIEEFAVGSRNGYARVVSPVTLSLSSPKPHALVSTSAGGAVVFHLEARPSNAFLFYLLLGSASGTSPGVHLGAGVDLPLVPDWYTQAILQSLGSPVFEGFLGKLDGNGAGQAQLHVEGGVDPALIGITLHHAFAVFDPNGVAVFASNAIAVALAPDPNQFPPCSYPAPPFAPPGTELVFDGSAAVEPNGSSFVHTWDFGDGSSATGAVVTHAFASQGIYEVTHHVQDQDENASTCLRDVPVDLCLEVESFLGSWLFDAGESGADLIDHYAWSFGDGTSLQSEFPTVFHHYSGAGTFTVTLTRTYDDGATSTCSLPVVVVPSAPPDCEFEVTPLFGSWLFDASGPSDGFVELYDWDFGDGNSAQTDFPTILHSYPGPGTFTVTLTTTFYGGISTSTCIQVVVVP